MKGDPPAARQQAVLRIVSAASPQTAKASARHRRYLLGSDEESGEICPENSKIRVKMRRFDGFGKKVV